MSDILEEIDETVYMEAWEYIDLHDPALADKIKRAVQAGKQPDEIRSRYLRTAGEHRSPKGKRVENAARYLQSMQAR